MTIAVPVGQWTRSQSRRIGELVRDRVNQAPNCHVSGSIRGEWETGSGSRCPLRRMRERTSTQWAIDSFVPTPAPFMQTGEEPFQNTSGAKRVATVAGNQRIWAGPEGPSKSKIRERNTDKGI